MRKGLRYTEITNDIKISVESKPLVKSSKPHAKKFAFSYTITIENHGTASVKLLERHWIIKSGGEQIAEVVGAGVVGEQPRLNTGESFRYTSGAIIEDPIGSMHGSYTFRSDEGRFFEATIPDFDLLFPTALH